VLQIEQSGEKEVEVQLCQFNDNGCREINDSLPKKGYDGKWWEFQANQVIGALLLPKMLLIKALDQFLIESGTFGTKILDPRQRMQAINFLSDTFNVNPAAAKARVDLLYPTEASNQLTL